jgi:hypothetical protein
MTINFINYLNAMILLPDSPLVGDYIATDWDGCDPNKFLGQEINWYCSQVIDVDGDKYRVIYDDGAKWYTFKEFGTPSPSKRTAANIYPALPPMQNRQQEK